MPGGTPRCGDLGERQVGVVAQDDDGALRRRKGEERLFDELAVGEGVDPVLGRRLRARPTVADATRLTRAACLWDWRASW